MIHLFIFFSIYLFICLFIVQDIAGEELFALSERYWTIDTVQLLLCLMPAKLKACFCPESQQEHILRHFLRAASEHG
jgi:hypothetical protein